MRKILVASHGKMAEGMVHSVSIFAGESQQLSYLCAYTNEIPLEQQIQQYFNDIQEDQEVLIFTDLLGGSVNRAFLPYLKRPHTHLIAGVHLALLLEFILKPEDYLAPQDVLSLVEASRAGVAYMNLYEMEVSDEDE